MNQDVPPLPYLIDIEGGLEGGEAVKDSEGGDILIHNGKLDPTRSSKPTFSRDITPQLTYLLVRIDNVSLE